MKPLQRFRTAKLVSSSGLVSRYLKPAAAMRSKRSAIFLYRPEQCSRDLNVMFYNMYQTLRRRCGVQRKRTASMVVLLESGKRDLNSRPQPWQGCALPTELFPHCPYCHSGLQSYANIPTFQIFLEKISSSVQHSVLFKLNLAL